MSEALIDTKDLASAIGSAIADGLERHSPKQVSFGEYERRRMAGRPALTREYWQTGQPISEESLKPSEITLLNRISRPGRYINRMVEIVMRDEHTVEISYNNARADQRMENKSHWRSFEDLLTQVVAAQDAENAAEEEDRRARPTRPNTFQTKATREAQDALAARTAHA